MISKPFLLLDCNLSSESGETFCNAVERAALPQTEFVSYRLADSAEPDWLRHVLDGKFCGIVVSGSAASPKEEEPWVVRLVREIREATMQGVPTLGICFGHQLIAYAWDGDVGEDVLGYKVRGIQPVTIEDTTLSPSLLLNGGQGEIEVLASHRDQVLSAPDDWLVVGHSSYCPIQALRAPNLPILTVQWHPEGDKNFIRDNPHPDWESLPYERLSKLSGHNVLANFLALHVSSNEKSML